MSAPSPEVRAALEAGPLVHMTTVNPDGSPQVSLVWIGLEDDEIVTGHLFESRKVRNVRRDPRVALSMVTGGTDAVGMANYLVVHGTARIVDGGAPQLLQRLAGTYIGPGVPFPPMPDPPPGVVMRTRIDRIGGSGPWSP